MEQHFRDIRIHPIHEGTTSIQAMDLLDKKVAMQNARALMVLKQEIKATIEKAQKHKGLGNMADDLSANIKILEK